MSVLIAESQAGDKRAREVLRENNLGLVHHIVRRFSGRGYEAEDLFQIGVIGLMKAIDRFDLRQQVRFSTYAVPLFSGEIKRFLRDDGIVKVSRTLKENGMKVRIARGKLMGLLNREPTLQEIAAETALSCEEIVMAMEAEMVVESIDCAVCQDDGSRTYLVDKVVQGERGSVGGVGGISWGGGCAEDPEKEMLLNRLLVQQLMDELEEQDRKLIYMRYFQNKTQVEVASRLQISQVQVSRLEKKILLKMRERVSV